MFFIFTDSREYGLGQFGIVEEMSQGTAQYAPVILKLNYEDAYNDT